MDSHASRSFGLLSFQRLVPALTPVLIVSLLMFTMACSGASYSRKDALAPVVNISQGLIATKGVTIQAANGSFVLESGQAFRPPFQVDGYNLWYTSQGQVSRPADLTGRAMNALEIGAERVIVTTPYLDKPLFGVLLLSKVSNKVSSKATGPGSRSYYIEIPETYVREATGGRTSYVYERIQLEGGDEWFNWALWMSDVDFPPLDGGKDRLSSSEREAMAFENFDKIMMERAQLQATQQAEAEGGDFGSTLLYILLIGGLVYGIAALAAAEEEEADPYGN
ncbi:MAG: hypothetical protein HYZ01_07560 [Ignavibacteriales bacterium]|nr:hypothetical protein [Ignavibacteriales bacterium]